MKQAEWYFSQNIAFSDTKRQPENVNKKKWIEQVGAYYYHSLILAGFDPVRADDIFDQPADVIAKAVVSMNAHHYVKTDGR